MNYHNIKHDDILNGEGLRVTLFVSGCTHHCFNCQNQQTWDEHSGIEFGYGEIDEIFEQLDKDYISGITLSGGDPLARFNLGAISTLCLLIRKRYGDTKTIWLYTGYTYEELCDFIKLGNYASDYISNILGSIDVLVDGEFKQDLLDVSLHWKGSGNQRVIDVKKTLANNKIILLNN